MKAIHTPTQEEYNKVVQIMLDKGWGWAYGDDNINEYHWCVYKEETCVDYSDNIEYCYKEYYIDKGIEIISVAQFLKLEGKETKKPTGGEWTYKRADGVVFTRDSIQEPGYDTLSLEQIESLKVELKEKAKKLQHLQASHKKLFTNK